MPVVTDQRDEAAELINEAQQAFAERGNFEQHWQEIAERILPAYGNTFDAYGDVTNPGAKKTEKQFDSTAAIGLERFVAVIESLLTPENSKWHRIRPSADALLKDRDTRLYFEQVNDTLFRYRQSPAANFVGQNTQQWTQLGAFGTGVMYIDRLEGQKGTRYRAIHIGEIAFFENHQGRIDKAIRRFSLTARQVRQWFGEAAMNEGMKSAETTSPNRKFWFLHCVKPNDERDVKRIDYRGMEFSSYYVGEDVRKVVKRDGYRSFPYAVSRYKQFKGEIYGRSPAMTVLPTIKTLNEMARTILKQGQRAVDPVLLLHDDGVLDGFNLQAGATNYGAVTADGRPLVHTLPTGNLEIGKELMDDQRLVIKDAFLETLFQILTENPEMTATEVVERVREKGMLLAPTVGRQNSEYCGPLIEREIEVLAQQRLLPPMPPALAEAQGEYKIVYDSPLARAARAEEVSGLMRTVEWSMNVAMNTQNPEPMDHFDWDVIIPEVADIQAVPIRWLKPLEMVMATRQQRTQQTQTQQMVDAAPAAASVMKVMGGSKQPA